MSDFGYRKELDKYEDIDEDELLASLTNEEIEELERELEDLDPDINIPVGLRQKALTEKPATGSFDRKALMAYWEKETQRLLENERATPDKDLKKDLNEEEDNEDNFTESDSDDSDADIYTEEESTESEAAAVTEEESDDDDAEENTLEESGKSADAVSATCNGHDAHNCTGYPDNREFKNDCRENIQRPAKSSQDTEALPNLKMAANRPSGNPTVIEDTIEMVRDNDPDLTEVNLNNIENVTTEALVRFADALKDNSVVKAFSLANTHADDHVAMAIARMLSSNQSVMSLNIDSNFVTGKGIIAIIKALQYNTSVTEFRFHNQRHILGGQVEMEIAELLKNNNTVLKLGYHFELPGPRMSMTRILTRNLDRQRQKRLQEQKQQDMGKAASSDSAFNPRSTILQKSTPVSSPYSTPKGSPWSSPKLPKKVQAEKYVPPPVTTPPPPPPPPPPLPPPPPPPLPAPEKKSPTRNIAEAIKLQEKQKQKLQNGQQKLKSKRRKKEKENHFLKEVKNSLKSVSDMKTEERSRPSTPQRCLHDDLMASIRASSIKQLKQVEVPEYLR
ncbi:leiomodin-2 [Protopterus annectens]|uniref:leiomodin-2 n=1 Tax=Protopterus annectens TaxID=7888 RepID=UPI001CFC0C21|nr:leiomodin-2 [Protopterus annectens]